MTVLAPRTAQDNPSKTTYAVLGVSALGFGLWAYRRMQTRRKLADMLSGSASVQAVMQEGFVAWTPESKAAEEITVFNTKSADVAFAEILSTLPGMEGLEDESILAEIEGIAHKGSQAIEQVTGVDLEEEEEKGSFIGRASSATRSGWSWLTGIPEAKTNPALTWGSYLNGLE